MPIVEHRKAETADGLEAAIRQLVEQLSTTPDRDGRNPLRESIRALGPSAAPHLLPHLDHPDDYTRWDLVNFLGEWAAPETARATVEFALGEDEVHARWRSFWAVSRFDRDRTIPLLLEALADDDGTRRWRAALILSMMGRQEAGPELVAGLRHPEAWVRWEALSAIKSLAYTPAVRSVVRFLDPEHEADLRREAVLALGRIGTPLAVERLIGALDDPDPQVRWRASMALSRQGETVRPHLVARMARESDPEVREQLQEDLNRLGGKDG